MTRSGFVDVETWIEPAPFTFSDGASYRAFVSTVVLRPYLERIADERFRMSFLDTIVELALRDTPALTLDDWRLNIRARRA